MLVSKCFPSFIIAATKRPRLCAFMSSETSPQNIIHEMQHAEEKGPPVAPAGLHPVNPLTTTRQFGLSDLDTYHLHWKSTRHNTVATLTDGEGHIVSWASGGRCGFKHSRRGEYEAGYQCAVRIFQKIEDLLAQKRFRLELIYKGFGPGRQALDSALLTTEGENIRPLLSRLTDQTPLKIGGTRAKKARRL